MSFKGTVLINASETPFNQGYTNSQWYPFNFQQLRTTFILNQIKVLQETDIHFINGGQVDIASKVPLRC